MNYESFAITRWTGQNTPAATKQSILRVECYKIILCNMGDWRVDLMR